MKFKFLKLLSLTIPLFAFVSCGTNVKLNTISKYSEENLIAEKNILNLDLNYAPKYSNKSINGFFVKSQEDFKNNASLEWNPMNFKTFDNFIQKYNKILEADFLSKNNVIYFSGYFGTNDAGNPLDGITFDNDVVILNSINRDRINGKLGGKALTQQVAFVYFPKTADNVFKKIEVNSIYDSISYNKYRKRLPLGQLFEK